MADELYDSEGNLVPATPDKVPDLLRTGQVGFLSGGTTVFQRPDDGSLVDVPAEAAHQALEAGMVWVGNDEARRREKEAKFGTPGQQAATAVEGFASGLLPGIAKGVETSLGVDPEDIAAREEVNPNLALAANVGGTAVGLGKAAKAAAVLKAGGEAGLLGRAAMLTPEALAARAAASVVPEAAEGAGLATRAGLGAARAALEMPVYHAAQKIDESVIQNKPLTASAMMDGLGDAMLTGGAFGAGVEGALGLAERYIPKKMEMLAKGLDKLESVVRPPEFNTQNMTRELSTAIKQAHDDSMEVLAKHTKALDEYADATLSQTDNAAAPIQQLADQEISRLVTPVLDVAPAQRGFYQHADEAQRGTDALRKAWFGDSENLGLLDRRAAEVMDNRIAPAAQGGELLGKVSSVHATVRNDAIKDDLWARAGFRNDLNVVGRKFEDALSSSVDGEAFAHLRTCLLYTSPSPRDA